MIEILDTTLRDGGYVNNWNFSSNSAEGIIKGLIDAQIEYIECGFLKDTIANNSDSTLFNSIEQFEKHIKKPYKYALMINYGEFDIEKLPENKNNLIIRIAFKKDKIEDIANYSKKLKAKGYIVSLNPCGTNTYSDEEIKKLIETSNDIEPFCLTIVDTMGSMKEDDVISKFNTVDSNLNSKIKIGFHFHNNLQMAYANAKILASMCKNRDLIIDSTLYGMGRASGNLCTELIAQYLNSTYGKNYNLDSILNNIDNYIQPIYKLYPWGYSIYYFLSAINKCHPNYAKYLKDNGISLNQVDKILKKIPKKNKSIYDFDILKNIVNNC